MSKARTDAGTLTVRNLDAGVKDRLRVRAAMHGRSMEAEARAILAEALAERPPAENLADAIRRRFATLGGVELPDRPSLATRPPPDFRDER